MNSSAAPLKSGLGQANATIGSSAMPVVIPDGDTCVTAPLRWLTGSHRAWTRLNAADSEGIAYLMFIRCTFITCCHSPGWLRHAHAISVAIVTIDRLALCGLEVACTQPFVPTMRVGHTRETYDITTTISTRPWRRSSAKLPVAGHRR